MTGLASALQRLNLCSLISRLELFAMQCGFTHLLALGQKFTAISEA